jgi:hypothetical protein
MAESNEKAPLFSSLDADGEAWGSCGDYGNPIIPSGMASNLCESVRAGQGPPFT